MKPVWFLLAWGGVWCDAVSLRQVDLTWGWSNCPLNRILSRGEETSFILIQDSEIPTSPLGRSPLLNAFFIIRTRRPWIISLPGAPLPNPFGRVSQTAYLNQRTSTPLKLGSGHPIKKHYRLGVTVSISEKWGMTIALTKHPFFPDQFGINPLFLFFNKICMAFSPVQEWQWTFHPASR